ncbi:ABC transporter ATP-binding protein [Thermotoga caldifontis]|uniref:ABC transporter ATP-binding protein n=1 Tax=Thermotoga caldifontis TaxID=1508419 RepID=UPI000597B5D1|nr:ABC transporter ATP-binding protein [Thermotoga caldifontis]
MSWIVLENVTKRFSNVVAVQSVSLQIEKQDFFTLLGPSGCGKTTTLRLIAGLEFPDEGRIYIAGRDVTMELPKHRNVAMVFQNYALYPHMTVRENIAYPLVVRKIPKDEVRKKVAFVAESLQISELLDRYPQQISGGQQQRVALARAVIQTPNVFLLDEPLSNLDAKLRIEARSFLKRLSMELGTSVVYVTHDQSEAMALSTKIAVMNQGRVLQVGTPREIYDKPINTFVASFIGNPPMNIIECYFDGSTCVLEGRRIDLSELSLVAFPRGKGFIGIRPENVLLDAKNGEIAGEVYVVEPLGFETIVTVKINSCSVKVLVFEDVPYKTGDKVFLRLRKDKLHVFDENGVRILRRDEL